ncbi:unnamed protein product [Rhodiola kirilowii]
MKQKALKECEMYTSKYAQCAMGRTLSVVWKCREQAAELNDCLHQFTNDSVLEEMKRATHFNKMQKRLTDHDIMFNGHFISHTASVFTNSYL